MNRKKRGFSIIELMTVVTIVAVLAAIAIPQYQSYTLRAKVSEALGMAGACKTAVTDYLMANSTLPADLGASGCEGFSATHYVGGIDVVDGVITVTLATLGELGPAAGGKLKLTPTLSASNSISAWTCEPDTLPSRYLPGPCRGT